MEPYKQKEWLYAHYVQKRMNLKDIQKLLKDSYNVSITVQALYNWVERYDLLKFRGKGRNLRAKTQHKNAAPKSPMQLKMEALKREQRRRQRMNKDKRR